MRNFLLAVAFALTCSGFAQTPTQVVQAFADDFSKKDFEGAAHLVKGGTVSPEFAKSVAQEKTWPVFKLSNIVSNVSGDMATVKYHIVLVGVKDFPSRDEKLSLVKVGDRWLILPPATEPTQELLPVMAYTFGNPMAMTQARSAAESTLCLSNIKQVCLAIIIFANDYDDVLKMTASNWTTKIKPYAKNTAILKCPLDKGPVSYGFNSYLAGKSLTSIPDPANTIMVYEGSNGQVNFRHNGRAAIGLADGHAKLITKAQLKLYKWKP